MTTHLLQVHYDTPAIRPMYPSGFGYKKSHPGESAAMKAIHKARNWFCVWMGLLSFLIAMAETKEHELRDYPHLSKKGWADYLLEKGAERTWIESLINSEVSCFRPNVVRSGTFLHLIAQDSFQPSVEWFCKYHVPVWYHWGPEQASNPRFAELAPPTYLLQMSATAFTRSPSRPESETSDTILPQEIVTLHAATVRVIHPLASSQHDRFLASWNLFLLSRKSLRQRIEQAETPLEQHKRLSRERHPPTKSAKVFRWIKDVTGDGYIRTQVSKKWREDTLSDYSVKQAQYDSHFNEWDCSSELGSDDESDGLVDDDERPGEDIYFMDFDEVHLETLAPSIATAGPEENLGAFDDNEEWLPFCHQPRDTAFHPSLDALEEEIMETASTYFGYTSPLPLTAFPPLKNEQRQKHILRYLGFSWNESTPVLFNRPRILALVDFIDRLSGTGDISSDEWDIDYKHRASVAFTERFQYILEILGPNGPLFMFNFHDRSTVKWKLAVTSATHALLVCQFSSLTTNSCPNYYFFNASDNNERAAQAKTVGAREKQHVLYASDFIMNREVGPAPLLPKAKRTRRRPALPALS
ncbi:hypothetical protein HYPSUDRAFT_197188 [Hypholoma sublateritium FD-334 SS-4]|uniref:Uncharacterized protein n=1 Tax=Hypholoma sublateritium (strain FD-334 SS-4) TaxID=945553 RepID=A0A0D2MWC3_HYPSF|nr:hypothetical protein HYPSUDRAFT_197188 [Hypholoma sublateritium FD-334 SS-4]